MTCTRPYYRSDVKDPQLVKRAEAEQALRRAAELGHLYATMMLAVLLDRGTTVKRDNAEAIRWAERALSNPAKDRRPIDMQVLLARLLAKSDDSTEKPGGNLRCAQFKLRKERPISGSKSFPEKSGVRN